MANQPINVIVGKRLRMYRRAARLTQQDVAEAIGKSRVSVTMRELGKQNIELVNLYPMAAALGIDVYALLPSRFEVNGHGS